MQLWFCLLGSMFSQAMKKWVQGNSDEVSGTGCQCGEVPLLKGALSAGQGLLLESLAGVARRLCRCCLGWAAPRPGPLLASDRCPRDWPRRTSRAVTRPLLGVETEAHTFPSLLSVLLSEGEACDFE